ncbi:unnamed protein product [Lactuca saligna]|uniref:Transposase, Ptta/En/Spm, plant n=1 Tax=Lactuca saligna TaxID=75948 RepID=A0AA35Z2P5_LACSI|nr:unnamed protein product [Lactuca saligna]
MRSFGDDRTYPPPKGLGAGRGGGIDKGGKKPLVTVETDMEWVLIKIASIMKEFMDDACPTWKKVMLDVQKNMFNAFRGIYQWPESEEDKIFEGFKNILDHRYIDIINGARKAYAFAAKKAGHVFPPKETYDFSVMYDFPTTWITFDKKPRRWKEPVWGDVFKQTHLEKSAKVKLASRELIGSQLEHWVNEKSWTVFDKYEKTMCEKYGPDPSQHPLGDVEIWGHCVGRRKKGRFYGVGSSGPGNVVPGTPYECGSSSYVYALYQKKINELESMLEREVKKREEIEANFDSEVKLRKDMENRLLGKMNDLLKKFTRR